MVEDLLIDVSEFETRVALFQGDALQEIHLERDGRYSLTGNVYKGRVNRIVPGMQAAFVEVGLARPGFLHVRDIARAVPGENAPDIRDVLHEGQNLLVQIAKDPIGSKGARLTTSLAIAARYLVLMPFGKHMGISQRIEDDAERERLRTMVETLAASRSFECGLIVRTAAEGATEMQLLEDIAFLERIWRRVSERGTQAAAGTVVYEELPLHIRIIRDLARPNLNSVIVNERETFDRVRDYVMTYLPEYEPKLQFDAHTDFGERQIDAGLKKALARDVPLKSGGYLVIEETEAMATIDVNSGGFVGAKSLEETAFRMNVEAAQAIPRQLRTRNIGGLIVVDFIDMEDAEHQRQVLRALEKAFDGDPNRVRTSSFSEFGLVEISRKRTRRSIVQQVLEPCDVCGGSGLVKTVETTCFELFRTIRKHFASRCHELGDDAEYLVRASQSVVDRLLDEEASHLDRLCADIGRRVQLQVEPSCGPGEFDLVLIHDVART